jgi:hypothetical protein
MSTIRKELFQGKQIQIQEISQVVQTIGGSGSYTDLRVLVDGRDVTSAVSYIGMGNDLDGLMQMTKEFIGMGTI